MNDVSESVREAGRRLAKLLNAGQLDVEDEETLKAVIGELENIADQLGDDARAGDRSWFVAAIRRIGWLVLLRSIGSSDDCDL